jgi:regulator of replication initiation timing
MEVRKMQDLFLQLSDLDNVLQYVLIVIVLVGFSPYGIYFAKSISAWRRGAPMPKLVRKGSKRDNPVADVINEANEFIDEAHRQIHDLEMELACRIDEIHALELENEALKERLRSVDERENNTRDSASTQQTGPVPAEIVEALAHLWLVAPPLPMWDQVKSGYREAVKLHHPDQGGDPEAMKSINAAYDILKKFYGKQK